MQLTMMKSKIHRATVTEANLDYVGSVTIDEKLMEEVGLLPNEKVQIVNVNNGARIETYTIKGERDSGVICLNGPAARLFQPNDIVIIIGYAMMDEQEARQHTPQIAIMGEDNTIEELLTGENHGEKRGASVN